MKAYAGSLCPYSQEFVIYFKAYTSLLTLPYPPSPLLLIVSISFSLMLHCVLLSFTMLYSLFITISLLLLFSPTASFPYPWPCPLCVLFSLFWSLLDATGSFFLFLVHCKYIQAKMEYSFWKLLYDFSLYTYTSAELRVSVKTSIFLR